MSSDDRELGPGGELGDDAQIRRSVGRTLLNGSVAFGSLALIAAWGVTGIYELQPGESAVILRVGERSRTVETPGLGWHLPSPIETLEIVNVAEIRKRSFGLRPQELLPPGQEQVEDHATPEAGESRQTFENAMQTADSNIVNLGFVLQYQIDDPFGLLYGMAEPEETLFDLTRASVREVVGQLTIDEVLSSRRKEIEERASAILRSRMKEYFDVIGSGSAYKIGGIRLQVVQPPAQVQPSFDDVISARQDEGRSASQARGDARETIEQANAKVLELAQSSEAYKESKVLVARGEASRFLALLTEYHRAPEVTRRRLYLETMEQVLPEISKMIIEPGAASVMPLLQLHSGSPSAATTAAAVAAQQGRRQAAGERDQTRASDEVGR